MSVASLVLGLLSLACGIFGFGFRWLGLILAIIALILSGRNKDPQQASMAKAGKVCAIIGLILCIIVMIVGFVVTSMAAAYVGTGILEELAELIRSLTEELTLS